MDKIIYLVPCNNKVDNYVLKLENDKLKQDLKELSNLEFHDYDYTLGKITINNLYNSNTYFVNSNITSNNNLVLNNKGLIGILNNNMLTLVKDLTLSVKINNNLGILKDNQITIVKDNYQINDPIYAYNLSQVNQELLIGYIKNIKDNTLDDVIEISYLDIDTSYVVILK